MSEKISIIVPVYNVEKYLEECIESILDQNYNDFEIILVNDGSIDKSREICESYSNKDMRVKVINQENKGVSSARNTGIRLCDAQSRYLMFVDADDKLLPNALNVLVEAIEAHDADMSIGSLVHGDDNGLIRETYTNKKQLYSNDEFIKIVLADHPFAYYSVRILYDRSFLGDLFFEENRITGEDSFFVFNCALRNPTVAIVDEDVYFYRSNLQSATRIKFTKKKYEDICYFLDKKITYIEKYYPELKEMVYNLIVKTNMMLLKMFVLVSEKDWHTQRKQAMKDFFKYKAYFVYATDQNKKWFKILKNHLYFPYKIFLNIRKRIKK